MDEAAKFFFTQGILGVLCVVMGLVIFRLWRTNQALFERLEAKSDKNSEKNQELAAQAVEAVRALSAHQRKRSTTRATQLP